MSTEIVTPSIDCPSAYCRDLGSAKISPDTPVSAGDFVTWTLTYTAGQYGIDDGASLLIAVRQMCDWGEPQLDEPTAPNYVTARTTANANLQLAWNRRAYRRPWRQALTVRVQDGHVGPGDTIAVTLGDRSAGSPGLRVQTFVEADFSIRVLLDTTGSHQFDVVGDLIVPVESGPAVGLALISPSAAVVGRSTWMHLRAHDAWGNVATGYDGVVEFSSGSDAPGTAVLPERFRFSPEDRGFRRFEHVSYPRDGIWRVSAADVANGLSAVANPCRVVNVGEPFKPLYWGDLHGQSGETVGSGDAADYWSFLHYASGADYGAHCGNDFQITPEFYRRLRELVRNHHEPERFVSFLSYEWSGNHLAGGDHNVYFLHDDEERSQIHRSGHWLLDEEPDDGDERHPLPVLQDTFRGRHDVLILPHVGGRRANLDMLDDIGQSPVIEISSIHGRFFWFAQEALERGLKVGFIAGSDDHCGRPGVAPPSSHDLVVPGGLSAIYADELTRLSLWNGLKQRHCYGSSGERIIVDFEADGYPMGSEFETATPPVFRGAIHATAPIASVALRRGLDVVWMHDALATGTPRLAADPAYVRLRLAWSGANSKNRAKVARWDGELGLSEGRIRSVAPYNLSHPEEKIDSVSDRYVSWVSHTSGEEDGLWLDLEVTQQSKLTFLSSVLKTSIALSEIGDRPLIIPAGGTGLQLEARWVPDSPGPLDFEWSWIDEHVTPGEHAYWLWIMQVDGACAWSSPIFINLKD